MPKYQKINFLFYLDTTLFCHHVWVSKIYFKQHARLPNVTFTAVFSFKLSINNLFFSLKYS